MCWYKSTTPSNFQVQIGFPLSAPTDTSYNKRAIEKKKQIWTWAECEACCVESEYERWQCGSQRASFLFCSISHHNALEEAKLHHLSIKWSIIQDTMLVSTFFTLSFTLRGWMTMKAVQSKNVIANVQSPLWVGVSPVELVHDGIVHNHYDTPPEKNKLHTKCIYCNFTTVCPVFIFFLTLKYCRSVGLL